MTTQTIELQGSSEADRSEVSIALVGAMGSDLKTANEMLVRLLASYGYDSRRIRVSDIIKQTPEYANLDRRRVFEYYSRLIEGGNYICKTLDDKGALADMAMERIVAERCTMAAEGRRAFIIHSLKRPDEVRRLREVYGELFYTIAVFADEQTASIG